MENLFSITNLTLLAVGFVFVIMGIIMYLFPPKKINGFYGYRTATSMQNQEKWNFAQKYSAKTMALIGLGLMVFSFTKPLFPFDDDENAVFAIVILLFSMILLLLIVEKKLKKIST